jgi:glycosyltransferase involved in cell wall biosynthesis
MRLRPRACILSVVRPARDVRTFHREARSLARAGWDVTVIGRDRGPAATVDGVRIVPLPATRGAGRVVAQARTLRLALATHADVLHVTDVELLPAALVLRRAGRTVIYDCIEDYPAYMELKAWIPARLRPLARRSVAAVERVVAPRLDAVLTADDGTAARLRVWGANVAVVHNFPGRDEFRPSPPGTPRPIDVVYHGSLPAYHLAAMAEIARGLAARVPGARWRIVGEPDSDVARRTFAAALARAGLSERVRLSGRVPFPAVKDLLASARTGVVPLPDVAKFRVNVPMKLFEYLAAGVPAVASDLPGTRELLAGSDAAILVPPGDHQAFADALADLLRDPARAAALARRGRAAVEERFHWEREERTLLRVYAGLPCRAGVRRVAEEMVA